MRSVFPPVIGLLTALLLLAHAVVAVQKWRWVTALVEVIAAIVLLLHWWTSRGAPVPRTPDAR